MTLTSGSPSTKTPKIGLALSGGGARAMAFHLGCLRALDELGILPHVKTLSTVSGGSVIGAMYLATDAPFPVFEERVRSVLKRGLVWPTIRTAFTTREGPKALVCFLLYGAQHIFFLTLNWIIWIITLLFPITARGHWRPTNLRLAVRRFASRTTIFRQAIEDQLFKGIKFSDLKDRRPFLIVNAADLRTGSAFYFSPEESGSWRLGKLARKDIGLAYAVAASAAYPALLPALDEDLPFDKRDGSRRVERVMLTDGGVYDNLGLAPFWPDRDPSISLNVDSFDTIICCRAGYGLRHDRPGQFLIGRLKSAFACIHDRAQNAAMKRLYELRDSNKFHTVIIPYLGQDDSRLKFRPADLITREEAYSYPTDFSPMETEWIDRLGRRGEQLTKALIAEHAPGIFQTLNSSSARPDSLASRGDHRLTSAKERMK